MRKITLLLLTTFLISFSYAQSAKEMMSEMEGKWKLDDNGNVTIMLIVEAPELSKEEIYNRALNYFVYNYGSGKSVVQTQDKDNGLIVGKGLYKDVHTGMSLVTTYVSAWHILRVDAKDGKARIIVTLTEYERKISGGSTPPSYTTSNVSQEYPINKKGGQKTVMTKAFYKTFKKANLTLLAVEKAIKDGNTSKEIENANW